MTEAPDTTDPFAELLPAAIDLMADAAPVLLSDDPPDDDLTAIEAASAELHVKVMAKREPIKALHGADLYEALEMLPSNLAAAIAAQRAGDQVRYEQAVALIEYGTPTLKTVYADTADAPPADALDRAAPDNIAGVLAMPWGGHRNLAAKALLEPEVGSLQGVGVFGHEQVESIQAVCNDQGQASATAKQLKAMLPSWSIRHWPRSDGAWVAAASPPEAP